MIKKYIKIIAKELQLMHCHKLDSVYFHGYSMIPFLEEGDELIVKHVSWKSIKLGDIVTYRYEEYFPTYRVIEKKKDTLILKPDNRPKGIEVNKKDILGRVIERRRGKSVMKCNDLRWILYSKKIVYLCGSRGPIWRFVGWKIDGLERRLKKLKGYLQNID